MTDLAKTHNSPSNQYLSWDVLMIGGLSTLVCAACWIFLDKSNSVLTVSQFAFALAFIANHPHFTSSYLLLYKDFRKKILTHKRYFFSAVIIPLILVGILATALFNFNNQLMGHVVASMFLLVGWHYVKQTFGFVIVSSAQRKIFYKISERRLLLANLFSVWIMSFLQSNTSPNNFEFYGIRYSSFQFPLWTLQLCYSFVALTFVAMVTMQIKKYVETGAKPAPPAVAAFVALYTWYLPMASHPSFAYLIPFFHSLQYLCFVGLFKNNQVRFELKDLKNQQWREQWINQFVGYFFVAFILGALFFEFIPKTLDSQNWIPTGVLGSSPFLAAFLLFINIHHYFIDNTIWRSDNPEVKQFLFNPPTALPHSLEKNAA